MAAKGNWIVRIGGVQPVRACRRERAARHIRIEFGAHQATLCQLSLRGMRRGMRMRILSFWHVLRRSRLKVSGRRMAPNRD
jgi:hypothetical protein